LTLVYGNFVLREFRDYDFAKYDPGWMVYTTISIAEDGDLDLRNQLENTPSNAADQTSLGKNGQWYPLHEFLMPLLTIPFYLSFGIFGCLIFNIVISMLLMVLLYELCALHVDQVSAFIATILTAFTTLFLNYTYSYSLDVFNAFMLVLSYLTVVKHRYMLGGFIWGLTVYGRLASVITMPAFILYTFLATDSAADNVSTAGNFRFIKERIYSVLRFLAGGVPVALCFFMTNWFMFGSPLTISYDQWIHYVDGQEVITTQSSAFTCSIMENLPQVILSKKSGLLNGAPLIIVAVAFGMKNFWLKARNEAIMLIVASVMLIGFYSKYCYAVPGEPGNRYLMPVAALCTIPLAFAVEQCFRSEKRSS
jgi:hypothetical protein